MQAFFHTHRCTDVCRIFGLKEGERIMLQKDREKKKKEAEIKRMKTATEVEKGKEEADRLAQWEEENVQLAEIERQPRYEFELHRRRECGEEIISLREYCGLDDRMEEAKKLRRRFDTEKRPREVMELHKEDVEAFKAQLAAAEKRAEKVKLEKHLAKAKAP